MGDQNTDFVGAGPACGRVDGAHCATPSAAASSCAPFCVMVVAGHPVMRDGIRAVLGRDPGLKVCCEAASEQEVIEKGGNRLHDLAIIDAALTDASGAALYRTFPERFPSTRVLVLSMHQEAAHADVALKAGANGYLVMGEDPETLIEAAHAVLAGRCYVSGLTPAGR